MSSNSLFGSKKIKDEGEHWLTISDLMAGLMMVFLFIAIAYMRQVSIDKGNIEATQKDVECIVKTYQQIQGAIYGDLNKEFSKDLSRWKASIDKNKLSFQFNAPEVLFAIGKSELSPAFKKILSDFIPRYLKVLNKFKSSIVEVRIEGHTSSEWAKGTALDDAYFFNMSLSQNRTRSVLNYSYLLEKRSAEQNRWIKSTFSAVGLASSKLIKNDDNSENKEKSRRVTFRIMTNADTQIRKIIERLLVKGDRDKHTIGINCDSLDES